jgi:hypothetical protein
MGIPTVGDPSGLRLNTKGNSAQGESNTTTAGTIGELNANRTTNGPKARVKQASDTRSTNKVEIHIDHPQPQLPNFYPMPMSSHDPYFPQLHFSEPGRGSGYATARYRPSSRRLRQSTVSPDPGDGESSSEDRNDNLRRMNGRPGTKRKLLPPPVQFDDDDTSNAPLSIATTPDPPAERHRQQILEIKNLLSEISTHFQSLSNTLSGIEEIERVDQLLDQVSTQRESKFNVVVDDGIGGMVRRVQETLSRCDDIGSCNQSRASDGHHLVDDIASTLRGIQSSVKNSWEFAEKLSEEAEKAPANIYGGASKIGPNRCYKRTSDNEKPDTPRQLPSLKRLIGVVEQTDEYLKRLSGLVVGLDNPKRGTSLGGSDPDSRAMVIPQAFVTTRHAAERIFDMLCQSCPIEDHSAHRLLLGLKTETKGGEDDDDEAYVQFHLAFESKHCASEMLWFRVTSKLTTSDNPLDPNDQSNIESQQGGRGRGSASAVSPSPTTPGTSYLQLPSPYSLSSRARSFSASSATRSVYRAEEVSTAVRFCISNHKQHADELAVSLSNSAHRLFYPSQPYLDFLEKSNLKPLSERLLDVQHPPSLLDKFRWMRLIAEAVLKFDVSQPLSHNLDAENVWFRELNSRCEIHWHIELLKSIPPSPASPASAPADDRETESGSHNGCSVYELGILSIADTLRKLGVLFLRIVTSPDEEQGQDKALEKALAICGKRFYTFLKDCLEGRIGQTSNDFAEVEVQKLFYKQVVQRLRKRENRLMKEPECGMVSTSLDC